MAFTQIRPINLGGGEIGTGIAMGLQQASNSLFQLLEQKKQRQYEREQTLLRIAEKGLTPMDAMYNSNSLISNKIKNSFIDFIKQKVVDKKGIDNDTVMQVLTAKNLLNSTINKIKQTEEYIAKQTDLITKNPDKYQRDKYDESLNQYLTKISKGDIVTMEELPRFIWPKEKNPTSWASSQIIVKGKPTQTDVPIDSQKIKRISTWTDDNTRIGKWTEGYGSDEGLQLGTKELFYNGNNSVDPDAPTEEERKEYIKKAIEIQNDPKSPKLFGSVELNAPYLYGVDKFAKNIQPDKEDIIIKWKKDTGSEKSKIKVIPENNDIWQFYNKPVKLTGYEGNKVTNVVELLYGQPKPELSPGLYFKVYKTTGDEPIPNKKEGENMTMQDLQSLFGGSNYETDYIPYEDIANMVEKQYKFENLDKFKNGRKKLVW
jgi:hypothetical protein